MQHKTMMVREYDTQHDFNVDEQKLSREGWSVEPTANQDKQPSLLERIYARFSPKTAPAPIVVTYSRQRPS